MKAREDQVTVLGKKSERERELWGRRRGSKARRRHAKAWMGHMQELGIQRGLTRVVHVNFQHPYTIYILKNKLTTTCKYNL